MRYRSLLSVAFGQRGGTRQPRYPTGRRKAGTG